MSDRLQRHSYIVHGNSIDSFRNELNLIFSRISLRLDQLDAVGQNPDMKGRKIVNVADGVKADDVAATGQISEDPTVEHVINKNASGGYAGLNATSRITKGVDTQDDMIVDIAIKGLVLKDAQSPGHYWRITPDGSGDIDITDLGTSKP